MTKTVSLKNFDFANLTDKGLLREKNEDFLAYFDTLNGHVFVLCDGMGGHNAGEYASELAVETVGVFLNNKYFKNPFDAVEKALKSANFEVYEKSNSHPDFNGMGTTIVLALIRDNRIYYGHIGDSRIYYFTKNKLKQITKDHSFVQSLVDEGIITKEDAVNHPQKNQLSQALGLEPFIEPDVSPSAIIPNNDDLLFLCSDGLNNMVSDKKIESELKKKQPIIDAATELINLANKKGGDDNISVQIVKFFNISDDEEKNIKKSKFFKIFSLFIKSNKTIILSILILVLILIISIIINQKNEELKHKENNEKKSEIILEIIKNQPIVYAYSLKKGDSFELLSEKFNIETSILKELNPNITEIKEGIHFKILIKDFYTVKSGDDLDIILEKYNIRAIELMKANDFCNQKINIGQELIIPINK
ncbi:MAG: Stp1/IreP family PP2C-type Ser/Thr phosphatase [Bacteroidales bacterium]|nr:Stp1/IreP family PP2C-type Ser/Thr phosphatase [Bacteroidales bacterium]MBN2756704.1 Stp1/IreP family PP2C-type Ser/Thr phosphatase [Bacteroidales bacterium]